MSLIIHNVQLDCVWEDKLANFAKVRALLEGRTTPGGLIVLPEMFGTGFSCNAEQTVEPIAGPTEAFMRELARTHRCCVIGGAVTPGLHGKARNQAIAVAPDGVVLARYTKMRPFSFGGEAAVHERGVVPVVFEWAGFQIAPLICYDLRFPELAREAVNMGAEMLVYIAAWPVKRQQHWLTLLQARAIENQAYVIGVNRCGRDPQFTYSGRSVAVDPHGIIIGDAGEREHVLRIEADPGQVREWREQFPALKDAADHSSQTDDVQPV